MRKLNGWQLSNRRMQQHPVMPEDSSRWARFLYRHSFSESQVIAMLKSNHEQARLIRGWVREHHDSAYIPLSVLETIGIKTRYDS